MPSLKYRDIDFLIQHLKHDDIHLYEALKASNDNIKNIADTVTTAPEVIKREKATFNTAIVLDAVVANDVNPPYIVMQPGDLELVAIRAKVPPVGASLIVDIIRTSDDNTITGSIFGTTKMVVPAGFAGTVYNSKFAETKFHLRLRDILTLNILQVGSTTPGRIIVTVVRWVVTDA